MRDMNFADVRQSKENYPNLLQPVSIVEEQLITSHEKKRSPNTEVDIVCVCQRSGSQDQTTVSLPSDTPGINDTERRK